MREVRTTGCAGILSRIKWQPLMTRWSSQLMASELAARVSPTPQSPDWLGFGPAAKQDLTELEERLGMALPPSYKSFLMVSNGWRRTTFAIDRIRPAAEVDWFRVENEHWVDAYSVSGSDLPDDRVLRLPSGRRFRLPHRALKSLVQISDVDDGVYLLNPESVTPDGEWEAWFFANWVPGAVRYPSFAHLMIKEISLLPVNTRCTSPRKRCRGSSCLDLRSHGSRSNVLGKRLPRPPRSTN